MILSQQAAHNRKAKTPDTIGNLQQLFPCERAPIDSAAHYTAVCIPVPANDGACMESWHMSGCIKWNYIKVNAPKDKNEHLCMAYLA